MVNSSEFLYAIQRIKDCTEFYNTPLSAIQVKLLLEAALRSPYIGKKFTTEFILVEDKETLEKLSFLEDEKSRALAEVPIAIVIVASALYSEMWIENATLCAGYIRLQAEYMSLGSSYIQVFGSNTAMGQDSSEYVRQVLDIPYQLEVLSVIGVGKSKTTHTEILEKDLKWENIHIEKFGLPQE